MSDDIGLAAFLGNPGKEYLSTRHNFAWIVLEALAVYPSLSWSAKFKGAVASAASPSGNLVLLKPGTYMNRSGESVGTAARFYRIPPERVLVVHDDLELGFGEVTLKSGGGYGGHNGLKSVAEGLGGGSFLRFRLGISRPARGSVSSYVLSRFSPEEEKELPLLVARAAEMIGRILEQGPGAQVDGQGRIRLV